WEVERLGCGRWPRITDEGDHVFDTDDSDGGEVWAAMAYEQRPVLVGDIAFGVAISEDRRWLTIAAAQYTASGQRHLA
ncbi:hypothetical protein, partial [Bordetella pertussis]|uniref:hypothetical protein n=1 Tax=Bordetella pertussis TaxID=520 RepID=UPI0030C973C6